MTGRISLRSVRRRRPCLISTGERVAALEIRLQQVFIAIGRRFNQFLAVFPRKTCHGRWNPGLLEADTVARVIPVNCRHPDQVDDTLESVSRANRQLQQYGVRTETVPHLAHDTKKVSAGSIHLVDERNTGQAIPVGLMPDGFRLDFNATDRTKQAYTTIKYAQTSLDLDGEVNVAWRIDDIDAVLGRTGGPCPTRSRW